MYAVVKLCGPSHELCRKRWELDNAGGCSIELEHVLPAAVREVVRDGDPACA